MRHFVPLAFSRAAAGNADGFFFHFGSADVDALRLEKTEAHGAADKDGVGKIEKTVDDADLVRHLDAAKDGHKRVLRMLRSAAKGDSSSFSTRKPATAGSRCATPSVRGMRPV